jgi:hypothetical protein
MISGFLRLRFGSYLLAGGTCRLWQRHGPETQMRRGPKTYRHGLPVLATFCLRLPRLAPSREKRIAMKPRMSVPPSSLSSSAAKSHPAHELALALELIALRQTQAAEQSPQFSVNKTVQPLRIARGGSCAPFLPFTSQGGSIHLYL